MQIGHCKTRSGLDVRILCIDPEVGVVAVITKRQGRFVKHFIWAWQHDGSYRKGFRSSLDLVMDDEGTSTITVARVGGKSLSVNGR